jgi:hypothetical protein
MRRPEELVAITTSGGSAASSVANNSIFEVFAFGPAFLDELRALGGRRRILEKLETLAVGTRLARRLVFPTSARPCR